MVQTALNEGAAEYQNVGDVSMLQVAVARLKKLWPTAAIDVLTDSPEDLRKCCPGARPLPRAAREPWIGSRDGLHSFLFTRLFASLPGSVAGALNRAATALEVKAPSLLRWIIRLRPLFGDQGAAYKDGLIGFLDAMEGAALFVVCGAGGFADDSRRWNWLTLHTAEAFMRHGTPVVMFGQGMGPLSDPEVLAEARKVLPHVHLVSLRGGQAGVPLLESLGVERSRILMTGDEAVELAYDARPPRLGQGLGINLRVASYSGIGRETIGKLRPVLHQFAEQRSAPLLAIPIAFHQWADDPAIIRELLADASDAGASLTTPLEVVRQTGRCRLVVTGAYHAAVFALAQGIPAVCLANSPYYVAKFQALRELFGAGCETILLSDRDALQRLPAVMERAWESAEATRRPLQEAALRQIRLSWSAYQRVKDFLQSGPATTRARAASSGASASPARD